MQSHLESMTNSRKQFCGISKNIFVGSHILQFNNSIHKIIITNTKNLAILQSAVHKIKISQIDWISASWEKHSSQVKIISRSIHVGYHLSLSWKIKNTKTNTSKWEWKLLVMVLSWRYQAEVPMKEDVSGTWVRESNHKNLFVTIYIAHKKKGENNTCLCTIP